MTPHQGLAIIIGVMLLIWLVVELGWGGGNPKHKDHNVPPGV
jgi:hypothetical protein